MGKVRDRFGGMGRFKGGLRCKGWVNSIIMNVIIENNNALYQIINLNVST